MGYHDYSQDLADTFTEVEQHREASWGVHEDPDDTVPIQLAPAWTVYFTGPNRTGRIVVRGGNQWEAEQNVAPLLASDEKILRVVLGDHP